MRCLRDSRTRTTNDFWLASRAALVAGNGADDVQDGDTTEVRGGDVCARDEAEARWGGSCRTM